MSSGLKNQWPGRADRYQRGQMGRTGANGGKRGQMGANGVVYPTVPTLFELGPVALKDIQNKVVSPMIPAG